MKCTFISTAGNVKCYQVDNNPGNRTVLLASHVTLDNLTRTLECVMNGLLLDLFQFVVKNIALNINYIKC